MQPKLLHGFSVLIAAGLFLNLSFGQNKKQSEAARSRPTVLFICEHGAAKSAIAAAYFNKLAQERQLNYKATFRGINPDAVLNPVAEKGLIEDGIDTTGWKPTRVEQKDLDKASRIVTLGCVLPAGMQLKSKATDWDAIPSPSQNYEAAREEIKGRVQKLVVDLSGKAAKTRVQ